MRVFGFCRCATTELLILTSFLRLLTPEVKLFAFTHISNSLGTINPVAELCAKARAVGALTLVDAAQSAGHMPLDVQELGCDFLAFSGHKMCGPTGIGVLYGRAELLDSMPPWHGGGEMIVSVTLEKSTFKKPPHRFEAGTPNIAGAIGLAAAIDYIEQIGRPAIFEHDSQLAHYAADRLTELPGTRVFGPKEERGALVGFVMDAAHPHDLTTFADQYGLAMRGGHHCNQPLMRRFGVSGTTRASFYFYNTMEEIDRMIEILHARCVSFHEPFHCHSERSEESLIICCAGQLMVSQRCFASLNMTIGYAVRFFSMSPEIEELYQEVILDHSRRPRNFGELPDAAVLVHGDNPACGDEIHLAVKFDADGGLEDIKFSGRGCAISQASASLMTMKLKGKSRAEVMEMLRAFHDLVTADTSEAPKDIG